MLGADERILERELEIFEALRATVAAEAPRVQDTARGWLCSTCSARWLKPPRSATTKPTLTTATRWWSSTAAILWSNVMPSRLVPNDITLNGTTHQLVVLTGPVMGASPPICDRRRYCA